MTGSVEKSNTAGYKGENNKSDEVPCPIPSIGVSDIYNEKGREKNGGDAQQRKVEEKVDVVLPPVLQDRLNRHKGVKPSIEVTETEKVNLS
jgi:hypothetical protein